MERLYLLLLALCWVLLALGQSCVHSSPGPAAMFAAAGSRSATGQLQTPLAEFTPDETAHSNSLPDSDPPGDDQPLTLFQRLLARPFVVH